MAKDNELIIKINGNIRGYQDALKAAEQETANLQKTLNTIAKTGAIAFAAFGTSIFFAAKKAAEFETIGTQFEVLTGSVEESQEVIKNLSEFAAETPFQFPGIANAAKQLLAFKIPADQITVTLRKIGDVAAAVGTPLKDLTLIFGQVKAAGKLTGERLLQLEERAVPIGPALAKAMGVAESSIRDLVSKGEVSFKTFEKAFSSLSEKGGLAFGGMAKRSQTLEGQLSTMADNLELVVAAVGKNFIPILKQATGVITDMLEFLRESPGLTNFISKTLIAGTVTGGLVTVGALAATMFLKLRASIIASAIATRGLSFAIKGLVGSTGIGLLVAFLPEIVQLFQWAFGEATDIVDQETKLQHQLVKDRAKIIKAERENASAVELAHLKNNLAKRRAMVEADLRLTKELSGFNLSVLQERIDLENEAIRLKFDKQLKIELDAISQSTKLGKIALDKKSQRLKDENDLIVAQLKGIEKEELAFVKRKQQIAQKERDAEVIQDRGRKDLAIENVRLLNEQIVKEEKELSIKRGKIQDDFLLKLGEDANKQGEIAAAKEAKAQALVTKEQAEEQTRIQALKDRNAEVTAILQEREAKEVDFLKRRQEIENQRRETIKISNEEERNLSIENIKLKNEQLLNEESEFFTKRDELKAEQREAETELQAELNELSKENRVALREEQIEELRNEFLTKEQIRSQAIKQELLGKRKENARFEEEEQKHGTIIATFKATMRTEEFQNTRTAAAALSQLQQSENASMRAIGKAAALVQIAIDTQRGAIAAYSALAGIPIVGPGLGTAAAAALIIFGAERATKVQAAQAGGIVAGTGFGDRMPFLLEPGELITPRQNFEEVISAVADQRATAREIEETGTEAEEPVLQEVLIGIQPDAADFLTVQQNEQDFLGISQRTGR